MAERGYPGWMSVVVVCVSRRAQKRLAPRNMLATRQTKVGAIHDIFSILLPSDLSFDLSFYIFFLSPLSVRASPPRISAPRAHR
jgi:hypothetical protein